MLTDDTIYKQKNTNVMKTIITEAQLRQLISSAIEEELMNESYLGDQWKAFKRGASDAWNSRNNVQDYTTQSGNAGAVKASGGFLNNFRRGYNQQMADTTNAQAKAEAQKAYEEDMAYYEAEKKRFEKLTADIKAKCGAVGRGKNGRFDTTQRVGRDAYVERMGQEAAQKYSDRAKNAEQAAIDSRRQAAKRNASALGQGNIE